MTLSHRLTVVGYGTRDSDGIVGASDGRLKEKRRGDLGGDTGGDIGGDRGGDNGGDRDGTDHTLRTWRESAGDEEALPSMEVDEIMDGTTRVSCLPVDG